MPSLLYRVHTARSAAGNSTTQAWEQAELLALAIIMPRPRNARPYMFAPQRLVAQCLIIRVKGKLLQISPMATATFLNLFRELLRFT